MPTLDADKRKALPSSSFAVPGIKQLPIHDASHVRAAISRFNQTKFASPAIKAKAAAAIRAAAKKFDVDISDDAAVMDASERHPSLVRLFFSERVALGEKRTPFAVVGDWVWDDYGAFQITRGDLDEMERNFHEYVRGQDLPVLNEDHDRSRAIGWVTDLERVSPDRLNSIVELNETGEALLDGDQYRYVSPELMRDYTDAATGKRYSMVAAGLAVTNYPRIKALGPISAAGGVGAAVVACSERGVTGTTPHEAAELLMAENTTDLQDQQMGDDGDPLPPCNWAPPYASVGRCPGYTKVLVDGDNDEPGDLLGCCALASQCNGYSPVQADTPPPPTYASAYDYSEGSRMTEPAADPKATTKEPKAEPATPAKQDTADMSEMRSLVKAAESRASDAERKVAEFEAKFEAEKAERIALSEKLANQEQAAKIATVNQRIDALVASNRITPAEAALHRTDENLVLFSEHPTFLNALEARPGRAVPFGEIGSGAVSQGAQDDRAKLASFVREFSETAKKEGRRVSPQEAAQYASAKLAGAI